MPTVFRISFKVSTVSDCYRDPQFEYAKGKRRKGLNQIS